MKLSFLRRINYVIGIYEDEDWEEGIYIPDFYDIVDEDHVSVI